MKSVWALAPSLLASALTASSQAAATPTARLTLARGSGADKCPDEAFLRKTVAARLGYDPFFPWARKTVIIEIARTQTGFRGTAQIVDDNGVVLGQRVLETKGGDCVEPMTALGLAISIALDDLDDVVSSAPPERPSPPSAASAAPPPPSNPQPPEEPAPISPTRILSRDHPFRMLIATGVDGNIGVAPSPSLGGELSVAASERHWMVKTDVSLGATSSGSASPGVSVAARTWGTTVLGCGRLAVPYLCVAAALMAYDARAEGNLVFSQTGRAPLLAFGLRAGAEFPAGKWYFVRGEIAGNVHALRPRVALDGQSIYEVGPVSGGADLSIGVRLF